MRIIAMAALPYIQLYIPDYLADTAHLSTLEHGAYLLLIMNYWQRGKALPNNDDRLAKIARVTKDEWLSIKNVILEFFTKDGELLFHKRIEMDLAAVLDKVTKASEAGRASSAKRNPTEQPTSAQRPFNGRSTDAEQTFNHKDTDTEEDTDKDSEKKEPALLSPEYSAIETLKSLAGELEPVLLRDMNVKPIAPSAQVMINIFKDVSRTWHETEGVTDSIRKAIGWLRADEWHVEKGYSTLWWLFDLQNHGKKALFRILEFSRKAPPKKVISEQKAKELEDFIIETKRRREAKRVAEGMG
jgi:uncharacterized protein YdaU (DUF1376 family)